MKKKPRGRTAAFGGCTCSIATCVFGASFASIRSDFSDKPSAFLSTTTNRYDIRGRARPNSFSPRKRVASSPFRFPIFLHPTLSSRLEKLDSGNPYIINIPSEQSRNTMFALSTLSLKFSCLIGRFKWINL